MTDVCAIRSALPVFQFLLTEGSPPALSVTVSVQHDDAGTESNRVA